MMDQNSARRGFLELPANHPVVGIPLSSLVNALIAVARRIDDFRSGSFPVQRMNCRRAVRVVGLLLAFFEEVVDHGCRPTSSAFVGLSELYVAFQKLHILLHDCSRPGPRIRFLMGSDRVSCEFRSLIMSAATAIDTLPMEEMGVREETVELARLAERHAWKAGIGPDTADETVAGDVMEVLCQFKSGVHPGSASIERILNHLEIRSWGDCNEEISFLEEEIRFLSSSTRNGGQISLVGSLLALMLYSRSVIFENGKRGSTGGLGVRPSTDLDCLNPEEFRCPISLELMKDPVTVSTGQTYDQVSILRWLRSGNRTCPVTGNKLATTDFVPNLALKNVMSQFFGVPAERRSTEKAPSRFHYPSSPAAAQATRMLGAFLMSELSSGSNEERSKAIYEIRLLAKSNVFDKVCLVEAGCVPWLLHFLASWDPLIQENSMAAILNLVKHHEGRKTVFESGGLVHILDVLSHGLNVDAKHNAAATLFYLSSVDEYRRSIGETPEAIPALLRLLQGESTRGKKIVLTALYTLLLFAGNYLKVLDAGAVPTLVELLPSRKEDITNDSLSVLNCLAERPEGSDAILRCSSSFSSLVEILRSSTSANAKEHCVSILLSLCNNGIEKVMDRSLDQIPHLMPALYSLLSDGSKRVANKARILLRILHGGRGQSSAAPVPLPLREQEQAVHV